MSCAGCPCLSGAELEGAGFGPLAIVVDAASEAEVKAGRWLVGKKSGAQSLLKAMLAEYIDDQDDIYITSALKCRPNPTKKAMQKKAMLECGPSLADELMAAGVERVLCTGPVGYGALTEAKALPAITKVRGRWIEASGFLVLATLPLGFAIGEPDYFRDIARDFEKFFTTEGKWEPPDVELTVVQSVDELRECVEWMKVFDFIAADVETNGFSPHREKMLAVGFGVIDNNGSCCVYVVPEDVVNTEEAWRIIAELLNDPKVEVVFHNAKFDLQHLRAGIEPTGAEWDPQNIQDTMMLHYALDERPMGKFKSHGLKVLAQTRYDSLDYDIDMGKWLKQWAAYHWDLQVARGEASGDIVELLDFELKDLRAKAKGMGIKVPVKPSKEQVAYLILDELASDGQVERIEANIEQMRDDMHRYLAFDVYYTARLYPDLYNECLEEDEDLLEQYDNVYMPGTVALAQVEYHGILLDRPMYERTRDTLDAKAAVILERIHEAVGDDTFSPGSPDQVKKYLYSDLGLSLDKVADDHAASSVDASGEREGMRSRGTYTDPARLKTSPTAAAVLKMLARAYPEHSNLLDDIVEWRNITKNAGTYIRGLLDRCDVDGRVHGSFNIHGTRSGRLSSTNPNLQNMPPASHTGIAVRSGFMCPPGYSYIDCDYKQLEVRVAAELSGDPVMIKMFEDGGDPHAKTSETIYGKADVSHYERMLGKIITFGLLYGRSPDSIATGPEAEDIVARGGIRWQPADVRTFFGNLLAEWNVYAAWRQNCRETPYAEGEIKFSLGRKRRFHFIPRHDGGRVGRRGINTPCQGTASDFCLHALIQLHHKLKDYPAQVVLTVHDALYVECRDDALEDVTSLVQDTMTTDTLWATRVPLAVDSKVSKRMSQSDDEQYAAEYVSYADD